MSKWRLLLNWLGGSTFRAVGVLLACLAGLIVYSRVTQTHYPIGRWLLWTYLRAWLFASLWAAGCLSTGHALLTRLLRRTLPLREHFVFAFALGVLASYLLIFLAGVLHLYTTAFFLLLPAVQLALGARPTLRTSRRLLRHVRARKLHARRLGWHYLPSVAFGLLAFALAYFVTLTPENVSYDAAWYHMANAERYATLGRIARYPEGWYLGSYPQLASHLYTWGFLAPGRTLFNHVIQCTHIEIVVFLATLASIPALVRRLLRGTRAPGSWAALFLFPAIFVYDSNLNGSADHIAAFFAIPVLLALFAVLRHFDRAHSILLAAMIAGAVSVKFTAVIVTLLPMTVFAVYACVLLVRLKTQRAAIASCVLWAIGTGLFVTAPYWAKNYVFYGNPVYPLAQNLFASHPWTAQSETPFSHYFLTDWSRPPRSWAGVLETTQALFTYSFVPNNWKDHYGSWPVFGALFTLLLGALPFLRKAGRLWLLYASTHVALFAWYWMHHFDRYLQTLVPQMASAVVAILVLAWRLGVPARLGMIALFSFQLLWSLDVPFIPSHVMAPDRSPFKTTADLLAQGYKQNLKGRFSYRQNMVKVGQAVPEDAKVLIHEMHVFFGIGRDVASDFAGTQGGISYSSMRSPTQMHALLQSIGVTHLLWKRNTAAGQDSLTSDLLFHDYLARFVGKQKNVSGMRLAALGDEPSQSESFGESVAVATCNGPYKKGVYPVHALDASPWDPNKPWRKTKPSQQLDKAQLEQADYVVEDGSCKDLPSVKANKGYTQLATRAGATLYARKR